MDETLTLEDIQETARRLYEQRTPKRATLILPQWYVDLAEDMEYDWRAAADAEARRWGFEGADVEVAHGSA